MPARKKIGDFDHITRKGNCVFVGYCENCDHKNYIPIIEMRKMLISYHIVEKKSWWKKIRINVPLPKIKVEWDRRAKYYN